METAELVTKGEFAEMIGVTPGRVSQMIAAGQIDSAAIEGEGQRAKIRPTLARQQLARRLNHGQRFGNGLNTRLDGEDGDDGDEDAPPARSAPASNRRDLISDAIGAEKLRQLRNLNQRAAEDNLVRRGIYVRADQTKAAMTKMAAQLVSLFEGGLGEVATALAREFKMPQRDVLHVLRTEFRALRARSAEQVRNQVEDQAQFLDDDVA